MYSISSIAMSRFDSRIRQLFCAALALAGLASAYPLHAAGQEPSGAASPQTSLTELLADSLSLYRTGKLDEAAASYRKALQQDPKSGEAYAGAARCLLKQEKVGEAFDVAMQGVAQAPDSPAIHTALGEVLFRKRSMYYADVEFVKAANAAQPDARAFLGKARIEEAMSLYAQAKKHIERAHALDPADPEIRRNWLGTCAARMKSRNSNSILRA